MTCAPARPGPPPLRSGESRRPPPPGPRRAERGRSRRPAAAGWRFSSVESELGVGLGADGLLPVAQRLVGARLEVLAEGGKHGLAGVAGEPDLRHGSVLADDEVRGDGAAHLVALGQARPLRLAALEDHLAEDAALGMDSAGSGADTFQLGLPLAQLLHYNGPRAVREDVDGALLPDAGLEAVARGSLHVGERIEDVRASGRQLHRPDGVL